MTSFGPGITQSVAGLDAAERAASRDAKAKRREAPKQELKALDHTDTVETSDGVGAARKLGGNEGEDAHDDKRRHPLPQPKEKPDQPSLDISG